MFNVCMSISLLAGDGVGDSMIGMHALKIWLFSEHLICNNFYTLQLALTLSRRMLKTPTRNYRYYIQMHILYNYLIGEKSSALIYF